MVFNNFCCGTKTRGREVCLQKTKIVPPSRGLGFCHLWAMGRAASGEFIILLSTGYCFIFGTLEGGTSSSVSTGSFITLPIRLGLIYFVYSGLYILPSLYQTLEFLAHTIGFRHRFRQRRIVRTSRR